MDYILTTVNCCVNTNLWKCLNILWTTFQISIYQIISFYQYIRASIRDLDSGSRVKKELLPKIADGKLVCSFALIEPDNSYGYSNIGATAAKEGEDYVLSGTKLFVEYARSSDYILTVAKISDQELGLFMVETNSPGIELKFLQTLDYSKQCAMILDKVKVPGKSLLASGAEAQKLLEALEERASVAKCAEMLGGMQPAFDMSVTYAKDREQFGQPIGTFQAIQHHCANMAVDVDSSRYITSLAAWKIARGEPAT